MELSIIFNSLLIILTAVLFAIYLWARNNANYWKRHGMPHKNILPFIGNFFGLLNGKQGILEIHYEMYNDKQSENSPIIGYNIFHKPCLILKEPELIKNVLIKDFRLFRNRYGGSDLSIDKIGGNNLFLLKGLKWKNLRTKLSPVFSTGKLKQMFYLKAEVGNELSNLLNAVQSDGKTEIDVSDIIARYTTDVIATCAFGIQVNSLHNPMSEFRQNGKRVVDISSTVRALQFMATFLLPQVTKIFRCTVFSNQASKFLKSTIAHVMDERQATKIVRNDLLDKLISLRAQYQDEQSKKVKYGPHDLVFDDDLLAAQSGVFFGAGFETSTSAVCFCLYELAKYPDIQEKVRAEIKTALEENDSNITYEFIDSLQYLQQVLAESLRIYPPLVLLDRVYQAPDKKTKYSLAPHHRFEIPHGMPINVPIYSIHMDPKYFPEPEKFDPDRFLDKSIYRNGTYMPFGLGPRKCIGERFALIQSKIALVNILKNNYVTVCDRTPKTINFDRKAFVTKSEADIWINIISDI